MILSKQFLIPMTILILILSISVITKEIPKGQIQEALKTKVKETTGEIKAEMKHLGAEGKVSSSKLRKSAKKMKKQVTELTKDIKAGIKEGTTIAKEKVKEKDASIQDTATAAYKYIRKQIKDAMAAIQRSIIQWYKTKDEEKKGEQGQKVKKTLAETEKDIQEKIDKTAEKIRKKI